MTFEVLQENLNHALLILSKVLANKAQLPLLSNILIRTLNGQLELTASNMETTIVTLVGAKIEEEGDFTVPGRMLLETVSGFSAEKITMSCEEGILLVSGGKFKAKINGVPASQYPDLFSGLKKTEGVVCNLDKKNFQKAVSQTIFVAATDESRPVLTGILFNFNDTSLILGATDGFRLSVNTISLDKKMEANKFIIPVKALTEVNRLLSEYKETKFEVVFYSESGQVLFNLGDTKIYTRLISGNFPDYEKIIPTECSIKIVIARDELLKAVKLAAVFARESANIVKLKLEDKKLKISTNASQVGENESEVEVEIEKESGEEFTVAFNFKYLLDLLSNTEGSEITAEFNGSLASGVFKLPSDPNFLHIIMPVRVQG